MTHRDTESDCLVYANDDYALWTCQASSNVSDVNVQKSNVNLEGNLSYEVKRVCAKCPWLMNTTREIRESVTYVQMCMGPYLLVHGTQVPSRLVERTTIGKNDACGVTEVLANTVTRD